MPITAFLAPSRPSRTSASPRRFFARLANAAREFTHRPAPSKPAAVAAPEPTDLFTADELPPVEDIEAAAEAYAEAGGQARAADRAKRKSKKLLDRLASGRYGAWRIERVESSRQVADLEKIAQIFRDHDLGPVPMRSVAPSLKVTRAAERELLPTAAELLAEVTA
ncbi:hypothetical protein [Streptomyces sp. RPT161]|uniref:hypothetical protein n=1 Tax=Streptomyces sp. RPT161 TaxID=3015993 RepID=UPI0022B905C0|nr:hypothetical protein [Streptomyces sp. RPT161]